MDICARTWRALEWDSLTEFLAAEASTAWGRQMCLSLQPDAGLVVSAILLDETAEALSLLEARAALSFEDLPELRGVLLRLGAAASLNASELLDIKAVLACARRTRGSLCLLDRTAFPHLTGFLGRLPVLQSLADAIDAAIDSSAQVKDEASSHLFSCRREIKRIDSQIKDELLRIIHSSTLSKALQEPLFTQRAGRYVLPVNASSRSTIAGIVHDSSASGLTVYVEPTVVVELANKLRLTEVEVEREVARILTELSQLAYEHSAELSSCFGALVELDFIAARARLAASYNGQRPDLTARGKVNLKAAKHPLLILQDPAHKARVIPNDLVLGEDERTMVVTGPNTGGKTVFLKTLGLLSLMVRAGLLLPVAPGSVAVVFNEIFADIGDEQSLAANLSTFSSHMTSLVEIVEHSGAGSLVLLDEIGVGTDPAEGAALARAILEHLNSCGTLTISTTHYGELKVLAYTQNGFLNASLDFDEATLSPTYRLRVGVPGSSKATTIAQRLGLRAEVVDKAVSYLATNIKDVQKLTEELESRLQALSHDEEAARLALTTATELERQAQKQLCDLDAEREQLRQSLAQEIEAEFKQARSQVRSLIAALQKDPSMRVAQETQKEVGRLEKNLKVLSTLPTRQPPAVVAAGMTVRVKSLNQVALIVEAPADLACHPDKAVTVRSGNIKMKVHLSDLEVLKPASSAGPGPARKGSTGKPACPTGRVVSRGPYKDGPSVFVRTSTNTLDLRGRRVEAALADLERFLDEACLEAVSSVMIIHGHGTGAVKSAVREYLSTSAYARTFRSGELYEGGDGVTVVEL